jgi:ribosomal protein S6--L-glutamate ligase
VGAIRRVAAQGEWRTNISLGGARRPCLPSPYACALAVRTAAVLGTDFVGVDLLPLDGGFVVLEANGAVEFDDVYALPGRDVYADVAAALGFRRAAADRWPSTDAASAAALMIHTPADTIVRLRPRASRL